jgi:hypothetical protein
MPVAPVPDRPNIHSNASPGLKGPCGHADVLRDSKLEGFASVPPVSTIWRQLGVLHRGCDRALGAAEWPLKAHGSPLVQRPSSTMASPSPVAPEKTLMHQTGFAPTELRKIVAAAAAIRTPGLECGCVGR